MDQMELLKSLGMFFPGSCACGVVVAGTHRDCRLCSGPICLCQHNGRVCRVHGTLADHSAEDCPDGLKENT
jgi:hypothetical protein